MICRTDKGSLLLVFGLLNTKPIIKPEKKFRLRLLKEFFQKKRNLELKIKQATRVKRRTKIRNRNSGM
jgi:hypothetical protein